MAVNCQHCGVKLYGEEIDKGACEHCQLSPAPPTPAPPDLAPTGPATRRRGDPHADAWSVVRLGAGFLFWAALFNLIGLVAVTATLVAQLAEAGQPVALALSLAVLATGALSGLLGLAGSLLCCLVPRRSQLQGRAIFAAVTQVALVCAGVPLLLYLYRTGLAPLVGPGEGRGLVLAGLAGLGALAVVAGLAHFLLLSGVSHANGDEELATKFLVYPFAVFGIALVVGLALGAAGAAVRDRGLVGTAGLFLNFLLSFLFTLYLLSLYRDLHELLSPAGPYD